MYIEPQVLSTCKAKPKCCEEIVPMTLAYLKTTGNAHVCQSYKGKDLYPFSHMEKNDTIDSDEKKLNQVCL
jgi:hypothetical protein